MTTVESLRARGYVIIPSLLSGGQIDRIRTALAPYLRGALFGRNDFEGFQQLLGYSIHSSFMGYVDGVHPRRLIEQTQRRAPGAATPTP